jgi:hypothetical protein
MSENQKNDIKNQLTIEQVMDLVAELGGEPRLQQGGDFFTARTICHGGSSHKLYYYDNTKLFRCYTECSPEIFDIYELVRKVNARQNSEWTLPHAINYVASYFGLAILTNDFENEQTKLQDWQILNKYNKINSIDNNEKQRVEMKFYDDKILRYLTHPHIEPWEKEGITYEVCESRGVCYNPASHGIVIPHYDIDGNLIGIRERTLVKEEEQYGKYKPAILNGKMYNHPLGFALYNLNHSKDAIKVLQKAIIFEGEKSTLLYASYFGLENDISVAVCGSSLITYQVELLLSLGVKEIIIAFDKQFQDVNDDEGKRWIKKLKDIHKKYSSKCQISFMFDKKGLLGYKDSPIDAGIETFLTLFKERIIL